MTPTTQSLLLPDVAAFADLATFVGRAKRVDPDGAARLVGHGNVLALYVSPVHGSGGPTVLGLRTMALAAASDVDVTVPLAALTDRLAREPDLTPDGEVSLAVPPVPAAGVSWAGVSPPRSGWDLVGLVGPALLAAAAEAGIAEVAQGAPTGSGAQAVAQLRGRVWGRPLAGLGDASAGEPSQGGVPSGVAFVAEALGFLVPAVEQWPALFRHGAWARLTTTHGHVLARRSLLSL